ncbi:FAD-dependent monooxygenase [Pseudoxanthomonas sp. JBR18]|uniref:FAD-dependent monooxygenase n=1 Tax=Pseudoxanthomonas sp. JBR18 TaxID=2969308 RepID=UPI002305F21B|nr:FAD-dependent monooxygenase [Pseudoxanthomonas sp. JBR18]WCE05897.1 FAD-dependent monooxygenase [Pseudoxanthomonas sp. JBR18]
MNNAKKILICGGGIAGPACAYWLQRYGHHVVIAEKALALRDGGQNVDIKGAGQQVVKWMGLAEAIEARNTGERGVRFVDAAGRRFAAFPRGAFAGLTADFEILRGDFAHLLYEAVRERCDYRFGTRVSALSEHENGVRVTFDGGQVEEFELVICAEGIGSSTRGLVLAEETRFRYLGACMAFFKIPRHPDDDDWACATLGKGTMIFLRPGDAQETTVLVTFRRERSDIVGDRTSAARALLTEALNGRGVLAERIVAALDDVRDFYFGPMSQVQASHWSRGRVVLLGDAAYCPTPFTGEGTALALVGAYLLAGEIGSGADHARAFTSYEALLRPYVEASQRAISPRSIRWMHPRTAFGSALARLVLRVMASRPVQRLLKPSPARREQAIVNDFAFPQYAPPLDARRP